MFQEVVTKQLKYGNATNHLVLYTLNGHTDRVTSICYSPNGQQIASGSIDKTIKIWDTATGQFLYALSGHEDRIRQISVTHQMKWQSYCLCKL